LKDSVRFTAQNIETKDDGDNPPMHLKSLKYPYPAFLALWW